MPFDKPTLKESNHQLIDLAIEQISHLTGASILELRSQFEPLLRLTDASLTVESVTDGSQLKAMKLASLTKIKAAQVSPQFYIWLYKEESSAQISVKEVLPVRNHSALSAIARIKSLTKKSDEVIEEDVLRFLEEFSGFLTVEDRGDYIKVIGIKDGDLRIRIILKPVSLD